MCSIEIEKNNISIDNETDSEVEDLQEDKYLTFHLNNEEYGIEIRKVTEIIGIQPITSVPDMPAYIKGVINLRGKVIPLMDVRLRFNISELQYNDRTCIIVININNYHIGLIVDYVSEVLDIPKSQVEPPPQIHNVKVHNFIQGMGKIGEKVKILLNADKLLFEKDIEKIKINF